MKVLIVEDEALACERLEKLLLDYDTNIIVLDRIDTVSEAASFMKTNQNEIDLVFLDIQLADGKSFEIFDKISYPHPVLFTTAYDEYALRAFKLNSVDYLLKPIRPDELHAALEKFKRLKYEEEVAPVFDSDFIKSIISDHSAKYKQRFLVKLGSRIQFKPTHEIGYFSAEDKICFMIHKMSGKRFIIDHTLEELDSGLLDPKQFFRISRQHIVNIACIKEMKSDRSNRFELILDMPTSDKLAVSRSRTLDFKKWINN